MRAAILLLALLAGPAWAQAGMAGDSRVASLTWSPGARLPIAILPGNSVMVVFSPLEKVQTISLDDPHAVQATASSSGDSVTIHTLRALPPTGMSVKTDQRSYEFVLQPAQSAPVPYMVRMSYQPQAPVQAPPGAASSGTLGYKLSGAAALRPIAMNDDGTHMYIRWSSDQLIPAVFALNDVGGEEMVDGYMRGDVFVIDRVHRRLIFRFDKAALKVVKIAEKARR